MWFSRRPVKPCYYENMGDGQAREDAFRSLNYATYFTDNLGLVSCCGYWYGIAVGGSYEFDDGYGDCIRNFMWALGGISEFAPVGENHLLRSMSVVQHVSYGDHTVSYRTFDDAANELLRLNFIPARVTSVSEVRPTRNDLNHPRAIKLPLSGSSRR